ncbi:MAG: CHAT domain-containing protein, partial [Bacteroidales bacterium]|nr:CHAT domain-containing protein [Bacteroidales bacterium]
IHLMKNFYKQLKNGNSKSISLQKTKLKFLNEADDLLAHPYFWSAYISIGDSTPIFIKRKPFILLTLLLFAGGAVLIFQQIRKNKLR